MDNECEDAMKNDWRDLIRVSDSPLIRYVRDLLKTLGRTVEDMSRIAFCSFTYENEPEGVWRKFELAPIILCELAFIDGPPLSIYWHKEQNKAFTKSQAAALLDIKRLSPDVQSFWTEDVHEASVSVGSEERMDLAPSISADFTDGDGHKYKGVLYLVKEEEE